LPDALPAGRHQAVIRPVRSHSSTFGFMLMERVGAGWTYKAYTAGGKVMTTCSQQGRRLLCDRTGRIAA
jgi:hypothetical protein